MFSLALFLPAGLVVLLLHRGVYAVYRRIRRLTSRSRLLRELQGLSEHNGTAGETLARLGAILPGRSVAIFENESPTALPGLKYLRYAPRPLADRQGLAARSELAERYAKLRTLQLAVAIIENPHGHSQLATRLLVWIWPWLAGMRRSALYLIQLDTHARYWGAGYCDDCTYLPGLASFAEKIQAIRLLPETAGQTPQPVLPVLPATHPGADESRDLTLPRIIHDVRLPLARISAMVEDLREQTRGGQPAPEALLARIARQLRTMESFTYDVLHVERNALPAREEQLEQIHLQARLETIVDAHLDLIERKRIRVHTQFPQQSPLIRGRASALDRILFNLLTNSFQFCTSPGSLWLEIHERGRHALLDIEDSGPGLVSQEHTFELSRRNIGRGGGGWGIGLLSARNLSRALGGRLVVGRPRHGSGARFLLVLPAEKV